MCEFNAAKMGFVVVSDYVSPNAGRDVSDDIQKIIDENPMRTIYFPDGEYILGKPILTSARPEHSVSLQLSNYAILRAAPDWNHEEAMVRIGGAEAWNTIAVNGSNYGFCGGIVDGSGVACGIAIESGRETSVHDVSIKHTAIGLIIKYGANSGSSDADIHTVNIVGNNEKGSVGVLICGHDNTLTNMRIASVETGVRLTGGGNFMRNLHPLFIYGGGCDYADSCGFDDQGSGNWYDFCYSDNFAVGFRMQEKTLSVYQTCFCFWYSPKGGREVGFRSEGKMNAIISKSKVNFLGGAGPYAYLEAEAGGGGTIDQPIFNVKYNEDDTYLDYLADRVIWRK